jgi:hypothetical protein
MCDATHEPHAIRGSFERRASHAKKRWPHASNDAFVSRAACRSMSEPATNAKRTREHSQTLAMFAPGSKRSMRRIERGMSCIALRHRRQHRQRRSPRLVRQGFRGIAAKHSKFAASVSNALREDRFTHASRLIASRIAHDAMTQLLYAGSNVQTKSHQNENFHEQTLLSLMKRWYKPI